MQKKSKRKRQFEKTQKNKENIETERKNKLKEIKGGNKNQKVELRNFKLTENKFKL